MFEKISSEFMSLDDFKYATTLIDDTGQIIIKPS